MNDGQIRENLESVRSRIAASALRSGRDPAEVRLVAVTKRRPREQVLPLIEAGQVDLGENFPQELWKMVESFPDPAIRWHLIGHLQSNKAKRTLPLVRMVHGVDSLKLLHWLDDLASGLNDSPLACLQVNTSSEASKHGWFPEALLADAEAIAACRALPIVGLMTIAGYDTTPEEARPCFVRLRELRDALRERTGMALNELSMGMSNDFEAAIEEGATVVRVGSALFEGIDP
ncbi:YggS family pyridoxal phosphate-dependent enzyme [soil metagenome]